mmetsp:Transcript_13646/g.41240  ORF Transcript_13646/g.41240 Transcript_13646/m.41240 type:complete len:210 (+) Transcript_13646:690-1319(+)
MAAMRRSLSPRRCAAANSHWERLSLLAIVVSSSTPYFREYSATTSRYSAATASGSPCLARVSATMPVPATRRLSLSTHETGHRLRPPFRVRADPSTRAGTCGSVTTAEDSSQPAGSGLPWPLRDSSRRGQSRRFLGTRSLRETGGRGLRLRRRISRQKQTASTGGSGVGATNTPSGTRRPSKTSRVRATPARTASRSSAGRQHTRLWSA